jgi:hypothetical protein
MLALLSFARWLSFDFLAEQWKASQIGDATKQRVTSAALYSKSLRK